MSSKFRLVYLWVEQYKNIENVEIRFTLDYKFIKDEQNKEIIFRYAYLLLVIQSTD